MVMTNSPAKDAVMMGQQVVKASAWPPHSWALTAPLPCGAVTGSNDVCARRCGGFSHYAIIENFTRYAACIAVVLCRNVHERADGNGEGFLIRSKIKRIARRGFFELLGVARLILHRDGCGTGATRQSIRHIDSGFARLALGSLRIRGEVAIEEKKAACATKEKRYETD